MPIRHYHCLDHVNSSEHVAVQQLLASVPATGDWLVLSNVGLPDRGNAWPGDIDIVMIGSDTVHCLEVKPWETNFLANPDNRSMIDDARRRTKAKSGYLHRLIARQFPQLNHRATILVRNAGITPPHSASRVDGSLGASDMIDIHQCAHLFDADARPPLTPAELDEIATLVDAGFDPSRCLIAGPLASTTAPTRVVRHVRGTPITPYVPPPIVVPSATDPSPVRPVTQVGKRPTRKRNAGTGDMPRKPGPRGASIVGYLPRTSATTVESAPLGVDPSPATKLDYRGKPTRRPSKSSPHRTTARRRRPDVVPYGRP